MTRTAAYFISIAICSLIEAWKYTPILENSRGKLSLNMRAVTVRNFDSSKKLISQPSALRSSLGIHAPRYAVIPVVYCRIKVLSLRRIDELNSVYDIDFQLDLDWEDPLVETDLGLDRLLPDEWSEKILPDYFDYTEYFNPCILIDNSISTDVEPIGGTQPNSLVYTLDGYGNIVSAHMHRTERYRMALISKINLINFPFDDNNLSIRLKSLPVAPFGYRWLPSKVLLDDGYCGASPRRRWRHEIVKGADGLSEWVLGNILIPSKDSVPDLVDEEEEDYSCVYEAKLQIVRECWSGFWSLIFPLFITSSLGFTMYASETSDVNSRLCNTITCCLTIVLFKNIVENRLPQVPFLTVLDKYLVGTTIVLFYQGFGHAACGFLNANIFTQYFGVEPNPELSHTVDVWFWVTSLFPYIGLQTYVYNKLNRAILIKREYEKINSKSSDFGFTDGFLDRPLWR